MDFRDFDIEKFANGTGNIIWLICGGLILAIVYYLLGAFYCCTIIGIPIGLQLFKLGSLCLHPCGYSIEDGSGIGSGCMSLILNIIWIFCGGFELALLHFVVALLFCITIIGAPLGMVHFRLAWLALVPFGKSIEKK